MKIIATTNGGYIAEITKDEIAQVMGFHYLGEDGAIRLLRSLGALDRYDHFVIGATIPVGKLWARLGDIRSREEELKKLAGTMHALAELISGAMPAIMLPAETPAKEG